MDDIIPFPLASEPMGPLDRWVVVEDPEQVALYLREWKHLIDAPSRVVCWADLPSRAAKVKSLNVYFHAMSHRGFQKADRLEHDLRCLTHLQSLTIPLSFVPGLDPDALPESLQRIGVVGDGRASFGAGRVFPGVRSLDAWAILSTPNTAVKFEPGTFPALRNLTCRLDDARGTLLDVIATYPALDSLHTGPIKDTGVFPRLAPVAIDFLDIERGSLASLEGIQRMRGLRYLRICNMNKLTDITALEFCEELEVLTIFYCANLRDHETLLKIPRLKSVFVFRCNALNPEALAADLKAKPGLMSRVWACNGNRRTPKI